MEANDQSVGRREERKLSRGRKGDDSDVSKQLGSDGKIGVNQPKGVGAL